MVGCAAAFGLTTCADPPSPIGDEAVLQPRLFLPGVVSTQGQREYGIAFTPDMTEAYFTRRARRGAPQIFVTRHREGRWTEPELAPFSGQRDEAPFITPDGRRMLFSSRRPLPVSLDRSLNVWEMERTGDGWSKPVPLAGLVNQPRRELDDYTTGDELRPYLLPNGALLYTSDADPDWGDDLYVADRDGHGAFVDPRPLRLNSYGDEANAAMSPGRRYLVFQGYRGAGGVGEADLYVAERTPYGWSNPRLLPEPINSATNDGHPSFSPDGRYFFFASDRAARAGYHSIYYVSVEALRLGSAHD